MYIDKINNLNDFFLILKNSFLLDKTENYARLNKHFINFNKYSLFFIPNKTKEKLTAQECAIGYIVGYVMDSFVYTNLCHFQVFEINDSITRTYINEKPNKLSKFLRQVKLFLKDHEISFIKKKVHELITAKVIKCRFKKNLSGWNECIISEYIENLLTSYAYLIYYGIEKENFEYRLIIEAVLQGYLPVEINKKKGDGFRVFIY